MLDPDRHRQLLSIARSAIVQAVEGCAVSPPDRLGLPGEFWESGASFVTLTEEGTLRGCIGSLEARQPLVLDIQEHAVDAALHDYRFSPVTAGEISRLHIEISVLTKPVPLEYASPDELPRRLRPNIDGVILAKGLRKATFLPQVWEQLPDPVQFLSHLCEKMGAEPGLWRREVLAVMIYQVECFEED